jgi:hypothetical protein
MDRATLVGAVDRHFATTGRGLLPWPNPRALGAAPRDEEYSRVLDPQKYRLLGARFEAWARSLVEAGAATRDESDAAWVNRPSVHLARTERLLPTRDGCLPVAALHTRIEDCAEAGLVIGVADPAVMAACIPDCGCDACDDGSQPLLDQLDDVLWHVVSGAWTRVAGRGRSVVSSEHGWSAEGDFARDEPGRWLAFAGEHVPGRTVTRGAAWLAQPVNADGKASR